MKQVSIAKLYNCTKQNINKRLRKNKRKKNADKKLNIGKEVKPSNGSIGRGAVQSLLPAPSSKGLV